MITDKDGKPGLRRESAAGIVLRDAVKQHMQVFSEVVRADRDAGREVVAAYVDGLAGAMALVIKGGHASRAEVVAMTKKTLDEALTRDLAHLAGIITVR